jgi:hypothetical protein
MVPELGDICDFGNQNIQPMSAGGLAVGSMANAPETIGSVAMNIVYNILTDSKADTWCSLQLFVGYPAKTGKCSAQLCKQMFVLTFDEDSISRGCDKKLPNLKFDRSNLVLDQQKGGKGMFYTYLDGVLAGTPWEGPDTGCAVGRSALKNATGTCCRTRWDDSKVRVLPVRPKTCATEVLDYSNKCNSASIHRPAGNKQSATYWNIDVQPTVIPGNGTLVKLIGENSCKKKGLGTSSTGSLSMTDAKTATTFKFVPLTDTCDLAYIVDPSRASKGLPAYLSMSTNCGQTTPFFSTLGKANTIQTWKLTRN